ncbi:MAG: hypothetical protein UR32_C0003G0045 [candidate division WS6 bacterium GW2011_GWE2_33_157]|nr:MAG: hypothetical protein UR32_C0003G0045 [candidate division WS6 bacterium GW2011_GWE2_33_157]KKP55564.1 MAG: hypothetical protein UR45_C0001G0046 [candidate division WS6 bacterium GW2011_WS6_33_547]KKP57036.1 MAG: hypothetical protein UR49_C0004G0047 [candidate division WS6 bacterium GW2011_GWF2_33_92]
MVFNILKSFSFKLTFWLSTRNITKENIKMKLTTKSVAITFVEEYIIEERKRNKAFFKLSFLTKRYMDQSSNGKNPKLLIYGDIL